MERALIKYEGGEVTVSFNDVKRHICPKASDGEVILFLKACQALGLNPFKKEIYLVKYGEEPASIIISWESYLKCAEAHPDYEGHEGGLIIQTDYGPDFREGAFVTEEERERLIGGWARVYRRGRRPFYYSVHISECRKYTKEGRPTRFWAEMPGTMMRKVALSRALREAFPSIYGGLVSEVEVPEGEVPEAFVKGDRYDWNKFWAKLNSMGIDRRRAHQLMGVESLKSLLEEGYTLGQIYEEIIRRSREPEEGWGSGEQGAGEH